MANFLLIRKPRGAGAAKQRIESIDASFAGITYDAVCDGIAAFYARRRKENVSDEVEIHAII
jgi:hypothetical protein